MIMIDVLLLDINLLLKELPLYAESLFDKKSNARRFRDS